MIWISEKHRRLRNILWRDNPKEQLKCVKLQMISFGTRSAPYFATRCIKKLAEDMETEFPLASKALLEQNCIDDISAGANAISSSKILKSQLVDLLGSAGFSLHKWHFNVWNFECDDIYSETENIPLRDELFSTKVSGILWDTKRDLFKISLPMLVADDVNEKGNVLSKIAQIYDPLGFISLVIITAKSLCWKFGN